jgi:hypothetical protein
MPNQAVQFGADQLLGTFADWNEGQPDTTNNKQRKFSLSKDGEETASVLHDDKTEVSVPYEAAVSGTVALPGTIGALVNSLMLTQIQVTTEAEGFAKMTCQAHDHNDGNAHDGSEHAAAHGVGVITGFGATDFLTGTGGADASLASSSLLIKCEHVDIAGSGTAGGVGTHTAGENYHGMIEAECTWNGVPATPADVAVWDQITVQTKTNNQGMKQTIVKGVKALVLA